MIELKFVNDSDLKVQAYLEKMTPRLRVALTQEMWRIVKIMANDIAVDKLSQRGPTTLGNVTGNLRRAVIQSADVQTEGDSIAGVIGIPQEVWYGKVHEFGKEIPEVVGKLMVFESGGQTIFTKRRKAFTLPERSFLRSTLHERQSWISERLNEAIARTIRE